MTYRPVLRQIVNHAGLRLSPVMVFEITRDRSIRVMRAIADVVDDGALCGELSAHPVMQGVEFALGEEAACDAGLVGEEEHEIAGVVQPPDRFCRVRHPADAVAGAHIAVVVIDDAVAVEEGGGAQCRAGRIIDDHVKPASASVRSPRRCRARRPYEFAESPRCPRSAPTADDHMTRREPCPWR